MVDKNITKMPFKRKIFLMLLLMSALSWLVKLVMPSWFNFAWEMTILILRAIGLF